MPLNSTTAHGVSVAQDYLFSWSCLLDWICQCFPTTLQLHPGYQQLHSCLDTQFLSTELLKQHVGHIRLEEDNRQSQYQSSGATSCAGKQSKGPRVECTVLSVYLVFDNLWTSWWLVTNVNDMVSTVVVVDDRGGKTAVENSLSSFRHNV